MHNHTHLKCQTASDSDNYHPLLGHMSVFFIWTVHFLMHVCCCRLKEWKGTVCSQLRSASLCSLVSGTYPHSSKNALNWRDDIQYSAPFSNVSFVLDDQVQHSFWELPRPEIHINITEGRHLRSTYCVCISRDGEVNMLLLCYLICNHASRGFQEGEFKWMTPMTPKTFDQVEEGGVVAL